MSTWYNTIPQSVRAVLQRSWDDLQAGVPGTSATRGDLPVRKDGTLSGTSYAINVHLAGNLDNVFYGGARPTNCEEAVAEMALADLNIITILFERMAAISAAFGQPESHLTQGIRWIRNTWCGTSAGFCCRFFDRNAQKALYRTYVGHGMVDEGALTGGDHPGCDCWRENPPRSPNGGLHFIVGNRNSVLTVGNEEALDSIHLDWTVPCPKTAKMRCEITLNLDHNTWLAAALDAAQMGWHTAQAIAGIGVPISPFKLGVVIRKLNENESKVYCLQGSRAVEDVHRIESVWLTNGRLWACQGQRGWDLCSPHFERAYQIAEECSIDLGL